MENLKRGGPLPMMGLKHTDLGTNGFNRTSSLFRPGEEESLCMYPKDTRVPLTSHWILHSLPFRGHTTTPYIDGPLWEATTTTPTSADVSAKGNYQQQVRVSPSGMCLTAAYTQVIL